MAEFVVVMSEFMRLCDSFKHCEDCPVNQEGFSCDCDHQGYSKTGAKELEHIIMTWAAEHPEQVYPTWLDWLGVEGLVVTTKSGYAFDFTKAANQIPRTYCDMLGIPPKEAKP